MVFKVFIISKKRRFIHSHCIYYKSILSVPESISVSASNSIVRILIFFTPWIFSAIDLFLSKYFVPFSSTLRTEVEHFSLQNFYHSNKVLRKNSKNQRPKRCGKKFTLFGCCFSWEIIRISLIPDSRKYFLGLHLAKSFRPNFFLIYLIKVAMNFR